MRKYILLSSALLVILISATFFISCESEDIIVPDNILTHLKTYPELEAVDLYKFIYQANMGPAHAKVEYENAHNWLNKEIKNVDPDNPLNYPLMEVLSENYVRLHLAPFMALDGDLDALTNAFVNSMGGQADSLKLRSDWETLLKASKKGIISYPSYDEMKKLDDQIKQQNWPVVHHGEKYKELYLPHYRLLKKDIASFLIADVLSQATEQIELEE